MSKSMRLAARSIYINAIKCFYCLQTVVVSRQNIVTFGISINAFEKGKQWQHALWTLFEVGSRRLRHSLKLR